MAEVDQDEIGEKLADIQRENALLEMENNLLTQYTNRVLQVRGVGPASLPAGARPRLWLAASDPWHGQRSPARCRNGSHTRAGVALLARGRVVPGALDVRRAPRVTTVCWQASAEEGDDGDKRGGKANRKGAKKDRVPVELTMCASH